MVSLLFLQHMLSKMKPVSEGGTRLGIVFNGSPLPLPVAQAPVKARYAGGSWKMTGWKVLWLSPDQLFYNTGINTYVWILTNRKQPHRKGKVQLIDATGFFKKMRRSLGNKRNEIGDEQRKEITRLYGDFQEGEFVRIFDNDDFGYRRITVERPLRLNFAVTDERLERVKETRQFQSLAKTRKRKTRKKRSRSG